MNKKEFSYRSADGVTEIFATKWEPDGEPKAILQIVHGMVEYIDRYDDFATFLTTKGYIVVGEDHLGHGRSVRSDEYHGYFGEKGNEWVIADIHELRNIMQKEYPGVPYLMLGHSMGSFLTRQYITEQDASYAEGLKGVIIMGTAWQPAIALSAGKFLAKLFGTGKVNKSSKLLEGIAFGTYLKKIENPKTVSDWLTKDEAIVNKYVNDPWCTFHFSPNAFYHMFAGMQKAHDIARISKLPEGLPILFCSGAEDPVGAWGEGVRKAFMVYSENSPAEVDIKLYDDDRHEILNETDRKQVYDDMAEFLDGCL
ncbi:MAG: alpha/beta fold hydrolase [Clostridiales bacterium]|nr:alpha/beta fold hydrolase [Candidatus Crickella caballi]